MADDVLTVTENLRTRRYPRASLAQVNWAKGCGVALTLASGEFVQLPPVGKDSPALASGIRAWLAEGRPRGA